MSQCEVLMALAGTTRTKAAAFAYGPILARAPGLTRQGIVTCMVDRAMILIIQRMHLHFRFVATFRVAAVNKRQFGI